MPTQLLTDRNVDGKKPNRVASSREDRFWRIDGRFCG